jgi:Transposase IS116/IS110/IS902 family
VGAHFGLTPRKYQSGETDVMGRISKVGDAGMRTMLYEAANVILTKPVKGSALKSWAARPAGAAPHRRERQTFQRPSLGGPCCHDLAGAIGPQPVPLRDGVQQQGAAQADRGHQRP